MEESEIEKTIANSVIQVMEKFSKIMLECCDQLDKLNLDSATEKAISGSVMFTLAVNISFSILESMTKAMPDKKLTIVNNFVSIIWEQSGVGSGKIDLENPIFSSKEKH